MKVGGMLLILGILVLVAGGIYLYTQQSSTPLVNNPQNNSPETNIPSSPGSSGSSTHDIAISNFAFSPSTLTISSGDTVIWTNMDSMSHTVTSDSGSELSSSTISNGATYSHTFNTAGTYSYHCSIHTTMKGTIIVQ